MKEYTKLNWSFWLSLMAFVISIVALAVFFCKVKPYCVVTIDTYIGVIAGFIGIAVTLVIGFQIYSFISIKDKIKEMSTIQEELLNTKENLSQLEKELKGMIYYSEGLIRKEQGNNKEAFEKLHYAILHFADIDSKKEELIMYIKLLSGYVDEISKDDFEEPKDFMISITEVLSRDIHFKMEQRRYYWVVKDEYEKIYKKIMNKLHSFKKEINKSN